MATRVKQKAAARRQAADKRPRAVARYQRISSMKAKAVIDLIRGKRVDEALAILANTVKAASPIVEKTLRSAIANAENNLEMDRANLYIAEISANQGPALKRMRAGSRGMAKLYKHRTSHITVILDQVSK
ncbi:MAG: 50S ribosomal protein L22 [Christensenellales bacterium]|jgi:large subunit ribosomal protein L22